MSTKLLALLALTLLVGCHKAADQPAPAAKRYHFKGKVVSIDQPGKMANIDAEAIPDFMEAMTMPYPVKPETELARLHPGDAITADVVVQGDSSWLENIVVTGHSPPPASK